jgi:hypothetical protein
MSLGYARSFYILLRLELVGYLLGRLGLRTWLFNKHGLSIVAKLGNRLPDVS